MTSLLIKLTENDKRIIFVLLAVLILVLVIVAFLGFVVTRVMRWQGKKINYYVSDPVMLGVIDNEQDFRRYAKKKNRLVFYHQARIPALIMLISAIFYVVASSFVGYTNPFSHTTGFATLLFVWDFSTVITVPDSGAGLLLNWPAVINTPHIVKEAWVSYIFVPLALIGLLWYLFTVQGFIARFLQIKKLSQKIFADRIENFGAAQNPQVPPAQPNNQTINN